MTTITIDRSVVEQALNSMDKATRFMSDSDYKKLNQAIEDLKAALAEPVQEPVAWRYQDARGTYRYRGYVQGFDKEYSRLNPVPLYTAPPQRKENT